MFSTAVGLSSCEDKDVEVVRKFIDKLGPEIVATFDVLWSHGDEDRLEKIAKLKMDENNIR